MHRILIKTLQKFVQYEIARIVHQKTNDGTIEVQYIADKALQAEWQDIKNANSQGKVRIKGILGSPEVADLRILFSIKWPLKALNRGPKGYCFEIDWKKLLEIYPFLNHANLCKPHFSVNQKPPEKKKLSPAEQAKMYRKLLDSGKVKNKAAIARKFGVSRAWVTKVLDTDC